MLPWSNLFSYCLVYVTECSRLTCWTSRTVASCGSLLWRHNRTIETNTGSRIPPTYWGKKMVITRLSLAIGMCLIAVIPMLQSSAPLGTLPWVGWHRSIVGPSCTILRPQLVSLGAPWLRIELGTAGSEWNAPCACKVENNWANLFVMTWRD